MQINPTIFNLNISINIISMNTERRVGKLQDFSNSLHLSCDKLEGLMHEFEKAINTFEASPLFSNKVKILCKEAGRLRKLAPRPLAINDVCVKAYGVAVDKYCEMGLAALEILKRDFIVIKKAMTSQRFREI